MSLTLRLSAVTALAAAVLLANVPAATAGDSTDAGYTVTTCDTVQASVQVPGARVRLATATVRDAKTQTDVCVEAFDVPEVPDALASARQLLGVRYHLTYKVPARTPAGKYLWLTVATRTVTYTTVDPYTGETTTEASTTVTRSYARATIARRGRVASQKWDTHTVW